MTNDEWVRESAARLAEAVAWQKDAKTAPHPEVLVAITTTAATALQEAIEQGRQSILDRLNNPDEAMVEALARSKAERIAAYYNFRCLFDEYTPDGLRAAREEICEDLRALAAELAKSKETANDCQS